MNQRIRELVEKAPYTTVSTEGRLFTQQDLAKFAELIVEECINICISNRNDDSAQHIEKHFGVEE
jgi:hypothetical protein